MLDAAANIKLHTPNGACLVCSIVQILSNFSTGALSMNNMTKGCHDILLVLMMHAVVCTDVASAMRA